MKTSYFFQPIHPFPARMAASIALEELRRNSRPLRVLDPMVGSGTTLVVGKSQGHNVIGYDTDPLALLISKAWCTDVDEKTIKNAAKKILKNAKISTRHLKLINSYLNMVV